VLPGPALPGTTVLPPALLSSHMWMEFGPQGPGPIRNRGWLEEQTPPSPCGAGRTCWGWCVCNKWMSGVGGEASAFWKFPSSTADPPESRFLGVGGGTWKRQGTGAELTSISASLCPPQGCLRHGACCWLAGQVHRSVCMENSNPTLTSAYFPHLSQRFAKDLELHVGHHRPGSKEGALVFP
jgi:hypothetical protein